MPVSKYVEDQIEPLMKVAESEAYQAYYRGAQQLKLDDLKSWAYEGLAKAGENWEIYCDKHGYDPNDTKFFPPYAKRRIHGNIYDTLRKIDRSVTRSIRTKAKQIQMADQGMGLSESEIVEKTGLSAQQVRSTIADIAKKTISFDSGVLDIQEPRSVDVASTYEANRLLQIAVDAMKDCTPEQQIVLALHYYEDKDLRDVAKILGMPESEATRLHTAAIMAVYQSVRLAAEEPRYG